MKYYINLIKGKHYHVLLAIAVMGGLGLISLFLFIRGVIDPSLASDIAVSMNVRGFPLYYAGDPSLYCGVVFSFVGFFYIPVVGKYSQDLSEYQVWTQDDCICIKFRKYEWKVKKTEFDPTKLFFRDKNHRFVPVFRAYQVYNAVYESDELRTKDTSELLKVMHGEGISELSDKEKKAFVKAIFSFGVPIYFLSECFGVMIFLVTIATCFQAREQATLGGVLGQFFLAAIFVTIGSFCFFPAHGAIKERKYIRKNPVYKRDVFCCEKYNLDNNYFITVGISKDVFFREKFRVNRKDDYERAEQIQWEACFYQYKRTLKVVVRKKNEKNGLYQTIKEYKI